MQREPGLVDSALKGEKRLKGAESLIHARGGRAALGARPAELDVLVQLPAGVPHRLACPCGVGGVLEQQDDDILEGAQRGLEDSGLCCASHRTLASALAVDHLPHLERSGARGFGASAVIRNALEEKERANALPASKQRRALYAGFRHSTTPDVSGFEASDFRIGFRISQPRMQKGPPLLVFLAPQKPLLRPTLRLRRLRME